MSEWSCPTPFCFWYPRYGTVSVSRGNRMTSFSSLGIMNVRRFSLSEWEHLVLTTLCGLLPKLYVLVLVFFDCTVSSIYCVVVWYPVLFHKYLTTYDEILETVISLPDCRRCVSAILHPSFQMLRLLPYINNHKLLDGIT
ncbi:hypothetical protein SR1949_49580 [Sphaerospermopsis reniformis]|uniref:Uncharacterized protein n=1 Tax=Sphaerospermopsis reniformis TaxID=531300 RepID=A0A480A990_9CYAN|nr:hypothetical protein SR1949_49580 [Sphaerospermopsis reniformis]